MPKAAYQVLQKHYLWQQPLATENLLNQAWVLWQNPTTLQFAQSDEPRSFFYQPFTVLLYCLQLLSFCDMWASNLVLIISLMWLTSTYIMANMVGNNASKYMVQLLCLFYRKYTLTQNPLRRASAVHCIQESTARKELYDMRMVLINTCPDCPPGLVSDDNAYLSRHTKLSGKTLH